MATYQSSYSGAQIDQAIGAVGTMKSIIWEAQSGQLEHESADVVTGYYYVSGQGKAALNSSDAYRSVVTDISGLAVGAVLVLKASLASGTGVIIYDANNTVLDYITSNNAESRGYSTGTTPVDITINIPANAKYVSASIRSILYSDISQFTVNWSYSFNTINKLQSDMIKTEAYLYGSSILYGKKWIACGDSFSDYTNKSFESGQFANKNKTYPRLIAERTGMLLDQRFMASGRTLAYPADHTFTNSLTCPSNAGYYQNIPADADYITIMLGINDCQHTGSGSTGDDEDATGEITLGTIDDTGTSTYFGAYNTVLSWIRNNRPFAHVGIIVTNGTTRQDYTEAQIAIAKKWGYPYINLNGDEKTPAMIRCYNPNMSSELKDLIKQKQAVDYDGTITGSVNTHPNWQAHEYESSFIENWLKSL